MLNIVHREARLLRLSSSETLAHRFHLQQALSAAADLARFQACTTLKARPKHDMSPPTSAATDHCHTNLSLSAAWYRVHFPNGSRSLPGRPHRRVACRGLRWRRGRRAEGRAASCRCPKAAAPRRSSKAPAAAAAAKCRKTPPPPPPPPPNAGAAGEAAWPNAGVDGCPKPDWPNGEPVPRDATCNAATLTSVATIQRPTVRTCARSSCCSTTLGSSRSPGRMGCHPLLQGWQAARTCQTHRRRCPGSQAARSRSAAQSQLLWRRRMRPGQTCQAPRADRMPSAAQTCV